MILNKFHHRGTETRESKPIYAASKNILICIQLCLCVSVVMMLVSDANAAYLDFSVPAREAALGGNGVAVPQGTSSLAFNPAGLGLESRFEISVRYENLFSGLEGDNLSTGNLSAVLPLGGEAGDAFGLSLDHFGANNLQQDRLQAAFGKSFDEKSPLSHFRIGADVFYLRQQFTLSVPLAGVNPANVSAGAFSIGLGVLYDPFPFMTVGISAEDLNQPNLGVVGVDTVPIFWRYGVAVRPPVGNDGLVLTLSQDWSAGTLETQAGAEWNFNQWGVALRAGGDANMGVAGFGWRTNGFVIDYAYQFSWINAPSLNGVGLPGSHLLEVGFTWENVSKEQKIFEGLLLRGQEASGTGQWKEAFWDFQQALLLNPQDTQALQGRAKALQEYNRQRAEAYFTAGQKAEDKGYFLEAQRDYEWAGNLLPSEIRYSDALERVKKTLTQGALGDPRVQKLLEKAVELLKEGNNSEAMKRIRDAQQLYPNDLFLDFMLNNFNKKAMARMKPVDKKVERLTVEAEIYRSKGRMDLARETWKKILEMDPENAQAKDNLAEAENPSPEKPLSGAEKSAAQALLEKGLNAYVNGDAVGAIRDWEEVLKIDPHNVNALNNLTRAKMEQGTGNK